MSRTIVMRPDSSKKVNHLLRKILQKDIQQGNQQSYLQKVVKNLYKNYHQEMEQYYFEILTCIDQWHIDWFMKSFQWKTTSILLKISHINFPNLKTLSLAHLQISNIEALEWMQFQNLQTLNLSDNKIVSLRPLKKFNQKKLQNVFLELNSFNSMELSQIINRIQLNTSKVGNFSVRQQVLAERGSSLAKLNTKYVDLTNLHELTFSNSKKNKVLGQKFKYKGN